MWGVGDWVNAWWVGEWVEACSGSFVRFVTLCVH